MVAGIHLKYLHGKNAYCGPNTQCRVINIMVLKITVKKNFSTVRPNCISFQIIATLLSLLIMTIESMLSKRPVLSSRLRACIFCGCIFFFF